MWGAATGAHSVLVYIHIFISSFKLTKDVYTVSFKIKLNKFSPICWCISQKYSNGVGVYQVQIRFRFIFQDVIRPRCHTWTCLYIHTRRRNFIYKNIINMVYNLIPEVNIFVMTFKYAYIKVTPCTHYHFE